MKVIWNGKGPYRLNGVMLNPGANDLSSEQMAQMEKLVAKQNLFAFFASNGMLTAAPEPVSLKTEVPAELVDAMASAEAPTAPALLQEGEWNPPKRRGRPPKKWR